MKNSNELAQIYVFGSSAPALESCPTTNLQLVGKKQSSRASRTKTRMNEREQLLFVTFLSLFMASSLLIASILGSRAASERFDASLSSIASEQIVVRSGETLWSIAEAHPIEGESTSDVVRWIRARNGLESSALQSGQVIEVPNIMG